jgi:hypothetical protein
MEWMGGEYQLCMNAMQVAHGLCVCVCVCVCLVIMFPPSRSLSHAPGAMPDFNKIHRTEQKRSRNIQLRTFT